MFQVFSLDQSVVRITAALAMLAVVMGCSRVGTNGHVSRDFVQVSDSNLHLYNNPQPAVGELINLVEANPQCGEPRESRPGSPEPFALEHGERGENYEAFEYYKMQRDDPVRGIDWSYLAEAARIRDALPAAKIGTGNTDELDGTWEFLGPRNTDVPFNQYWGPKPITGRISAIAIDPSDSNRIYVGNGFGGVHRSEDGGVSWTPLSDGWPMMHVSCIVVDPNNTDTIYVGTGDFAQSYLIGGAPVVGYSMGVMKSTNRGNSWDMSVQAASNAAIGTVCVSDMMIIPETGRVIATSGRGVGRIGWPMYSDDAGASWHILRDSSNNNLPLSTWSACEYGIPDGGGQRTCYLVAGAPTACVYRSTDNGVTWNLATMPSGVSLSNDDVLDVAASKTDAATMYLLVSQQNGSIYKSTNRGAGYGGFTGNFPNGGVTSGGLYNWSQAFYNFHITCSSRSTPTTSDVVYCGQIDIAAAFGTNSWTSLGGPTWSLTPLTHNDQHVSCPDPNDPNTVWFGNDGGLYKSSYDGGNNVFAISSFSTNLYTIQFYRGAVHPTNPYRMMGGAQDNGTPATAQNSNSNSAFYEWGNRPSGGDGGFCAFNPSDPTKQYVTVNNMQLWRTQDDGVSWNEVTFMSGGQRWGGEPTAFIAPIALNKENPRFVYCATNFVWRWDETLDSWFKYPQQVSAAGVCTFIADAPGSSPMFYTGSSRGELWLFEFTASPQWRRIDNGLPARSINSISVNPNDKYDILVGFGGIGPGMQNLWRCSETNALTTSWTSPEGTGDVLPDANINDIERDFDFPGSVWYVATDIGVFQTSNSGATWNNATQPLGLPNVQVNDLIPNENTRFMHAATFGRGMWRIGVPSPELSVSVSPNVVLGGNSTIGTISIPTAAPPNGYQVSLEWDSGSASMPASITIPNGETSASFAINTSTVTSTQSCTITARLGSSASTAQFSIASPTIRYFTFSQYEAWGASENPFGYIELYDYAPSGGITVDLESSNPEALSVQPTLHFPADSIAAGFTAFSHTVDATKNVEVTASVNGQTIGRFILVKPNRVHTFTVSQPEAWGGTEKPSLYLDLDYYGPPGGYDIQLVSSDPAAASVPATVHVSEGLIALSEVVQTHSVSSNKLVTISATLNGSTKQIQLLVKANRVNVFTISQAEAWGGSETPQLFIELNYYAPAGGYNVQLSSSDSSAASVPAFTHLSEGVIAATVPVTTYTVSSDKIVTITATLNGASKQVSLLVKSNRINAFTLAPSDVAGGLPSNATVNLSYYAPSGGYNVTFTSSNPSVVPTPLPYHFGDGQIAGEFAINTNHVTSVHYVTIGATLNGLTVNRVLVVRPAFLSVSGFVTFSGWEGEELPNPVTFEFRNPSTLEVTSSQTVDVQPDGTYTLQAPFAGPMNVALKHQHWLRVSHDCNTTSSSVINLNFVLINGDIDEDNEVTIVDFGIFSSVFGSAEGDPNWNPSADLNGDLEINIVDFGILAAHFGESGDD